jgi:KUP system potassium uptake protein
LAHQAIRLGYLPRLQVIHTSNEQIHQIYIPSVNWLMLVGCLLTVAIFRTSSGLAGAYGIAVTAQMLITTWLFALVARRLWRLEAALARSRRRCGARNRLHVLLVERDEGAPRAAGSRCSLPPPCSS